MWYLYINECITIYMAKLSYLIYELFYILVFFTYVVRTLKIYQFSNTQYIAVVVTMIYKERSANMVNF